MFNSIFSRLNTKRKHNKKHTEGRKIQMVPIFKRDKNDNKILDTKGKPIVLKYKKIYHI